MPNSKVTNILLIASFYTLALGSSHSNHRLRGNHPKNKNAVHINDRSKIAHDSRRIDDATPEREELQQPYVSTATPPLTNTQRRLQNGRRRRKRRRRKRKKQAQKNFGDPAVQLPDHIDPPPPPFNNQDNSNSIIPPEFQHPDHIDPPPPPFNNQDNFEHHKTAPPGYKPPDHIDPPPPAANHQGSSNFEHNKTAPPKPNKRQDDVLSNGDGTTPLWSEDPVTLASLEEENRKLMEGVATTTESTSGDDGAEEEESVM
jgi:hypothetical protein